jgi:hypothetical protein
MAIGNSTLIPTTAAFEDDDRQHGQRYWSPDWGMVTPPPWLIWVAAGAAVGIKVFVQTAGRGHAGGISSLLRTRNSK